MTPRNLIRIAAALVALGFLAQRWLGHPAAAVAADPPSPAISTRAHDFVFGTLRFTRCELPQPRSGATTAAYCAPFQVPENWDTPDVGRRIDLRLALIASDAEVADGDLVVLLAGGPGQSAVDSWPQVAGAFAPLRKHHHVLLLDQRGTGGSNALTCAADKDENAAFDADRVKAHARACLGAVSTHADPRFYTTGMALRDLEAVRQALGAPRFDLVGVSYGTRVAQHYLRRYPAAVRSVVLDSAVPNDHAIGSEFAVNLDAALQAQFAQCSAAPACADAFGDPWRSLHALRDALRAKPVDVAYRDPVDNAQKTQRLDEFSLAGLVRLYAYTPETSALLPLSIAQALKGDAASLVAQSRMLESELEGFSDNAMQLSVICSEDAAHIQPRAEDAQTLLGSVLADAFKAQCEVWPHGAVAPDFNQPASGDAPVLILAGEYDPVTPPRYAEQIVKTLPNARVLVAKGQGHSVMGRGCLPKLVERFVETLDAKALDAGCIAQFGPTPAFVGYNGAAP